MPPEVFQLLLEKGAGNIIGQPDQLVQMTAGNRLPPEIMETVHREVLGKDGLMTAEEAREHRLALLDERAEFLAKNEEEWEKEYIGFG